MRGTDEVETILDLVLQDRSRIGAVFFSISEDNVRKVLRLPWVSFGSDGASMAPEGVFLAASTHPRAYGNVARLLGKYVRDEKIVALTEAVRRLTSLPAANLGLEGRGLLKAGMFAPRRSPTARPSTGPHQYAVGMKHVLVNGVQVLRDGEHTGATPGRALWGPGKIR